jgi:hypothetical protein
MSGRLTQAELADRWGWSEKTIQNYRSSAPWRVPPWYKLGRRIFFELSDIKEFERRTADLARKRHERAMS